MYIYIYGQQCGALKFDLVLSQTSCWTNSGSVINCQHDRPYESTIKRCAYFTGWPVHKTVLMVHRFQWSTTTRNRGPATILLPWLHPPPLPLPEWSWSAVFTVSMPWPLYLASSSVPVFTWAPRVSCSVLPPRDWLSSSGPSWDL